MMSSIASKVIRTACSTLPKFLSAGNANIMQLPITFTKNMSIAAIRSNIIQGPTILSKFSNQLPALNSKLTDNGLVLNFQQTRNVTKFSLKKGKRKSVKAVLKRFKRLDWGGWIRTYTGRHKKLFKKSPALKKRLQQHVFVNATQSWLLDKMVTSYWRKPKYYIDDPYEQYQKRDEYFATRTTPREF